ncbi:hypothetical protein HL658_03575 [Azospirillum sp. RWY-5-1]|uniref:Antirestriction protein ArdA n=1 Tax=Azospirillum oleiclasticum TaxID=2735135 RepID=A0ABX2T3E6_9PROT|nr:hypothetical protein [Azospirillum oleiclasticum]NYZ11617.1 hypothetical protein [Azospirillum oleiclasticum]NYZ18778.1 hypothetical protein [Azospirillum oleiclasticum]
MIRAFRNWNVEGSWGKKLHDRTYTGEDWDEVLDNVQSQHGGFPRVDHYEESRLIEEFGVDWWVESQNAEDILDAHKKVAVVWMSGKEKAFFTPDVNSENIVREFFNSEAFGSSCGGIFLEEEIDWAALDSLANATSSEVVLSELEELWTIWKGTQVWEKIKMYVASLEDNFVGHVDWSDYADHFEAIFVTQDGTCVAEFEGDLIERSVSVNM